MNARESLERIRLISLEVKEYFVALDFTERCSLEFNNESLRKHCDITLAEVKEMVALRTEMDGYISRLAKPEFRLVLRGRYYSGRKWNEIAEALHFDVRYVQTLHGNALQELEKIIAEEKNADKK